MEPGRALVVGRFQPFHVGHLEAVRRLASAFDEVVVAIGSADVSHTLKNPFTASERFDMVRDALVEAGVGNAIVVPVQDVNRNAIWVAHVVSLVPRFRVFFTNNPLPAFLFRAAGFEVRPMPFVDRARHEGSRVRALLVEGGAWEPLVPPAVARRIREAGGPERLRALAAEDAVRQAEK